jgi:hypothetical protein
MAEGKSKSMLMRVSDMPSGVDEWYDSVGRVLVLLADPSSNFPPCLGHACSPVLCCMYAVILFCSSKFILFIHHHHFFFFFWVHLCPLKDVLLYVGQYVLLV